MQIPKRKPNTGSTKEKRQSVAVLLMVFTAISLFFLTPSAVSQLNIDYGIPDSAYYRGVQMSMTNCTDSVEIRLPIFLWTDDLAIVYRMNWAVSGATIDTALCFLVGPCGEPYCYPQINSTRDTCAPGLVCETYSPMTPGSGIAFEIILHSRLGQTYACSLAPPYYFSLDNGFYRWWPTYIDLDSTFTIPSVINFGAGDVDCSGNVTISDAVFAIQYIFAGGCSPYDPEAADPNGDCSITISDAVYLINYIFAGGNAPVAGCTKL